MAQPFRLSSDDTARRLVALLEGKPGTLDEKHFVVECLRAAFQEKAAEALNRYTNEYKFSVYDLRNLLRNAESCGLNIHDVNADSIVVARKHLLDLGMHPAIANATVFSYSVFWIQPPEKLEAGIAHLRSHEHFTAGAIARIAEEAPNLLYAGEATIAAWIAERRKETPFTLGNLTAMNQWLEGAQRKPSSHRRRSVPDELMDLFSVHNMIGPEAKHVSDQFADAFKREAPAKLKLFLEEGWQAHELNALVNERRTHWREHPNRILEAEQALANAGFPLTRARAEVIGRHEFALYPTPLLRKNLDRFIRFGLGTADLDKLLREKPGAFYLTDFEYGQLVSNIRDRPGPQQIDMLMNYLLGIIGMPKRKDTREKAPEPKREKKPKAEKPTVTEHKPVESIKRLNEQELDAKEQASISTSHETPGIITVLRRWGIHEKDEERMLVDVGGKSLRNLPPATLERRMRSLRLLLPGADFLRDLALLLEPFEDIPEHVLRARKHLVQGPPYWLDTNDREIVKLLARPDGEFRSGIEQHRRKLSWRRHY